MTMNVPTKRVSPRNPYNSDPRPAFRVGQTVMFLSRYSYPPVVHEGMVLHVSSGSYRIRVEGKDDLVYARKDELFDMSLKPFIYQIGIEGKTLADVEALMKADMAVISARYAAAINEGQTRVRDARKVLELQPGGKTHG